MAHDPSSDRSRIIAPENACPGGTRNGPSRVIELPSGVEAQACLLGEANLVSRDAAKQERACRIAGAIDNDMLPREANLIVPVEILINPTTRV